MKGPIISGSSRNRHWLQQAQALPHGLSHRSFDKRCWAICRFSFSHCRIVSHIDHLIKGAGPSVDVSGSGKYSTGLAAMIKEPGLEELKTGDDIHD